MKEVRTITTLQFCLHLSDKFLEGKKYDDIDWAAVDYRIDRQNLTVGEEADVRKYIRQQHDHLSAIDVLEKQQRSGRSSFLKIPSFKIPMPTRLTHA